jgi:hypothetical protein
MNEETTNSLNIKSKEAFVSNPEGTVFVHRTIVDNSIPALPPAFYNLTLGLDNTLYYNKTDLQEIPEKIYGNLVDDSARILRTFESRQGNTGVLLAGTKGSGKTLQAKLIAREAVKTLPVILVQNYVPPQVLQQAVTTLQHCCVMIDEFEKLYSDNDGKQNQLLSLLDGMSTGKTLYLLTVNEKRVNTNMLNRPGRIFYLKEYDSISFQFIVDYLQDTLANKQYVNVLASKLFFSEANFDIIKAVAEEMNRYPDLGLKALNLLNIHDMFTTVTLLYRPNPELKWVRPNMHGGMVRMESRYLIHGFQIREHVPIVERSKYIKAMSGESVFFDLTRDEVIFSEEGCTVKNECGELRISKFNTGKLLSPLKEDDSSDSEPEYYGDREYLANIYAAERRKKKKPTRKRTDSKKLKVTRNPILRAKIAASEQEDEFDNDE